MSFYIQQYRNASNHWSEFEKNKDYTIGTIKTKVAYFAENKYTDTTIDITNSILEGEKYFLSVEIERIGAGTESTGNPETGNTEKTIDIRLLKTNSTIIDAENQYIDTIILPKTEIVEGEQIKTSIFNFIITPNDTYQRIAFILNRDLYNINDIKLSANINVKKFVKLKNLIGDGINVSGSNINITQIGIHARPGTLMCINGEPIRVGKRGVFELNSTFRLQQQSSSNSSKDSTINNSQSSNKVGIDFLNIINVNEKGEGVTELYTIDYRYIKIEEAT